MSALQIVVHLVRAIPLGGLGVDRVMFASVAPVDWIEKIGHCVNEQKWLVAPLGVAFSIVVTLLIGVLSDPWGVWRGRKEDRKLRRRRRIHTEGQWTSTHNRMRTEVYNSQSGDWHVEEIRITVKGGKYRLETVDKDPATWWQAEGELFRDDYIHGTWWGKTAGVQGVMTLLIHPNGKLLTGHYTGRSADTQGGKVRVGPWVLAQTQEDIDNGKVWLDRNNITFRSDVEVDSFRGSYHSYHLTQIDGTDVWRHHCLDFTEGLKDPHILRATIKTKDGSGKGESGSERIYEVEGGKRGDHLLLFYRPNTDERQTIVVFPFFHTPGTNYGTISGANWDGKQFFGKVILSREPIRGLVVEGTVASDASRALDEEWNREFVAHNRVPPDAFSFERRYTTNGIAGIYAQVRGLLRKRPAGDAVVHIRILGFTLFSVVAELRRLFEEKLLHAVDITFYHLDVFYLGMNTKEFDGSWRTDVAHNVAAIRLFFEQNSVQLDQCGVTFRVVPYAYFPSVHGFAYGEHTYFVSFPSRDSAGKVRIPYTDVFMRVERGDRSEQARAFIELFENGIATAEAPPKSRSHRPPA